MKLKIEFEETLKYRREMIVETDRDRNDPTLNGVLTSIERNADFGGDVPILFEKKGFKVVEMPCEDLDSPSDSEIEIDNYVEI